MERTEEAAAHFKQPLLHRIKRISSDVMTNCKASSVSSRLFTAHYHELLMAPVFNLPVCVGIKTSAGKSFFFFFLPLDVI